MKTTTTAVRIKAEYNYYHGTLNCPQDGYLMSEPEYDSYTGREAYRPLEFDSVADAYAYLTGGGYDCHPSEGLALEYDGAGRFSRGGTYVTRHGQHSRPNYTIVSRKSGRCTKAIVEECDKVAWQS
jgi:hypothetical protein